MAPRGPWSTQGISTTDSQRVQERPVRQLRQEPDSWLCTMEHTRVEDGRCRPAGPRVVKGREVLGETCNFGCRTGAARPG